jgi:hypothetical protein
MHDVMSPAMAHRSDLRTAVRNRYFYGKLLDVYHFDLESNYLNGKRRLLNRVISGYGVVCGLDVHRGPARDSIVLTPGLALDKWGNEIVVPRKTEPIQVPSDVAEQALSASYRPEGDYEGKPRDEHGIVTVSICYHECDADPTPVLAGDCHGATTCEAGAVREQYRIVFAAGAAPPISTHCRFPDVISGGRFDYAALARWVSGGCPSPHDDPCIPLANVRLTPGPKGERCEATDIDITIRPIVYTNDLIFDLILALMHEEPEHRRGK